MWVYFVFFFSSRRRHTRLTCDWSSDVCSSDLFWGASTATVNAPQNASMYRPESHVLNDAILQAALELAKRSEERRVGKECRSRWWADHLKEKNRDRRVNREVVGRQVAVGRRIR